MCGGQGLVFLQPKGQEIRNGAAHKSGHGFGLLEGDRQRPGHNPQGSPCGNAEDAGVLSGPGPQGPKDGLGYA